jgi:hypothetical protein
LAGLLARPVFARPSRYIIATVAEFELQNENRLTAAGTAPVLHRIPYYGLLRMKVKNNHQIFDKITKDL